MTKEELIDFINKWKQNEYDDYSISESNIINLAETNAEYDDNLLFGVDVNVQINEITWYINKYNEETEEGECIFRADMQFDDTEALMYFLDTHSFDDILGDEYFEKSGISKYEE